jgi:site-specific recombinase XerD
VFLRCLAVEGRCPAGLADVVPGYAHWRLADLPRYLAAEQVNRLIAASDGEVVERRRDRAILLLLARLGLRAGVVAPVKGADVLRHTAATEMLRHGVPLEKIGLVLRHRGVDTTARYAKADVALLKQIAQPWPEVL